MRTVLLWAALAAGSVGSPIWAESIPASDFAVAQWQGFGMTDTQGGRVQCYAATTGLMGEQVMFQPGSDNRFALILALAGVQVQTGQVLDVSIWTDVRDAIAVPATATDEMGLSIIFTDVAWAVEYLSDGQLMTVTGEEFQQTFPITSADLALETAQKCLATHASDMRGAATPTP
jgi:hypothetical protein